MMSSILKEYEERLNPKLVEELKEKIKGLSDAKAKRVIEITYEEYVNAQVEPGEAVGLVTAESI